MRKIDTASNSVVATLAVGANVRHLAVTGDGAKVYASRFVTPPLPMKPGAPLRIDDKYERGEVRSLLLFYNPVAGWRRVACRASRTRLRWR